MGLFLALGSIVNAQTAVLTNYKLTRNTTGSFISLNGLTVNNAISAATTAANYGDISSALLDIGFDFYFMGTRYTQWSCNSNGQIQLGGTNPIDGYPVDPYGSGNSYNNRT